MTQLLKDGVQSEDGSPITSADPASRLNPIPGQPPSLLDLPQGCIFSARCDYADLAGDGVCASRRPDLVVKDGHGTRCHLSGPQILTIRNSR